MSGEKATLGAAARDLAKAAIYASGVFGAQHRRQNQSHLTVVMFHRVLPGESEAWRRADPACTISTSLFRECLGFFKRHYNVVSLAQVEDASTGRAPLPPCPLLITFDDGWRDTLIHAAPLLAEAGLPACCFLVGSTLDDSQSSWWQDELVSAWNSGRIDPAAVAKEWFALNLTWTAPPAHEENSFLTVLAMLNDLSPERRAALLPPPMGACDRQMLAAEEVIKLAQANIAIGAHGWSHIPLTFCRDAAGDLKRVRTRLNEAAAAAVGRDIVSLSFPHGRFDSNVVAAARAAGFRFIFTSESALVPLQAGVPIDPLFGRIEIPANCVADSEGEFKPHLLAFHLFTRAARVPVARLAA